jgi:dTDP-glucose pyrophosphorylase
MNFVIPMAGRGSRFEKAGYLTPKMLIKTHGKTLLEWSLDSLPLSLCSKLIFIGLKVHNEQYKLEKEILSLYSSRIEKIEFLWIDNVTDGQAQTVLLSESLIDFSKDLVIFNIDTFFKSSTLENNLLDRNTDGVLGSFYSLEDRFSYAKLDSKGFVLETAEKVVISDNALTGLYHFKDPKDFFTTAKMHVDNNLLYKNEYYIAPMYNTLIKKGKKFIIDRCDEHWILGTPEELIIFDEEYQNE